MRKIVEEQLNKCINVDLSNYDSKTNTYYIPKILSIKLEIDGCYLIELDNTLLSKTESQVLVSNWNHGTTPCSKYLKIDISKILGKMIYVNSLSFDYNNNCDLNEVWSGWLPIDKIKVIKKI